MITALLPLLLVLGDLVCTQRKAQLFAPDSGGQLVSGFGFHSSVHQDWAVANILIAAGLLHSEPDAGAKPLVYVELATNDALLGSNTAFFDRCLGWCCPINPLANPNPKPNPLALTL
eukprot:scaffold79064_cov66-Phaeocystis_antarctica.AAC.3